MFEYVTRRVGGETGRFVELIWFARGRITGVGVMGHSNGGLAAVQACRDDRGSPRA